MGPHSDLPWQSIGLVPFEHGFKIFFRPFFSCSRTQSIGPGSCWLALATLPKEICTITACLRRTSLRFGPTPCFQANCRCSPHRLPILKTLATTATPLNPHETPTHDSVPVFLPKKRQLKVSVLVCIGGSSGELAMS